MYYTQIAEKFLPKFIEKFTSIVIAYHFHMSLKLSLNHLQELFNL